MGWGGVQDTRARGSARGRCAFVPALCCALRVRAVCFFYVRCRANDETRSTPARRPLDARSRRSLDARAHHMLPPPAASDVADVGIHALEVYTPRHCVRAADLEVAHGCAGKYTHGLRMRESSTCDEDEDVASMAMSAVRRLLDKRGVRRRDVGMLMVGSESSSTAARA